MHAKPQYVKTIVKSQPTRDRQVMPPRWCTECVQSGLYMSDPGEGQMPESASSNQGIDVRKSARCIKMWSIKSLACYHE